MIAGDCPPGEGEKAGLPFWQALLLVLAAPTVVAIIEQIGETYRERLKLSRSEEPESKPTKGK